MRVDVRTWVLMILDVFAVFIHKAPNVVKTMFSCYDGGMLVRVTFALQLV